MLPVKDDIFVNTAFTQQLSNNLTSPRQSCASSPLSSTCAFPKSIHAVTYKGFLLKLEAFIFTLTLESAFV